MHCSHNLAGTSVADLALGDDVISIRKKLAAFPANTITISSNLPIGEVAGTVVLAIMVISIGVVFVTLCMSCHKTTASADLEKSKVASENGMISTACITTTCICFSFF